MLFGVITLFPDMFYAVTNYGVTGRSVREGILSIKLWNPREFSGKNRYRNVDDRPYGGGAGMLMMIKPLKEAIYQAKYVLGDNARVIYLSPQGRRLNQKFIYKLANANQILILVCGRYQGIDERLIKTEIDEEWSIGDYILSGGELAAMVLIDSISRVLTGVLKNPKSKESDSFFLNRLDCPNYTRPKNFEGLKVPAVLLSGHHDNIMHWRLKQSLGNTWLKRPDLLIESKLTTKEKELLSEFKDEYFSSCQDKKIK